MAAFVRLVWVILFPLSSLDPLNLVIFLQLSKAFKSWWHQDNNFWTTFWISILAFAFLTISVLWKISLKSCWCKVFCTQFNSFPLPLPRNSSNLRIGWKLLVDSTILLFYNVERCERILPPDPRPRGKKCWNVRHLPCYQTTPIKLTLLLLDFRNLKRWWFLTFVGVLCQKKQQQ